MVPLISGLLFFSLTNTSAALLPFLVSEFLQALLLSLSLSWGHIFLLPEGRCIRVSNLSFVPRNTLFTRFYYSLSLFLTSISLLILPSIPDFNSLPN